MDYLSSDYPKGKFLTVACVEYRPTDGMHTHNGKNSNSLGIITELHVIGSGGGFEQNSPVSFDEKTLALVRRFSLQDIACSILTQKENAPQKMVLPMIPMSIE